MKLYHGSSKRFDVIRRSQAQKGDVDVPEQELLNGIYLTPRYEFALAIASKPNGGAHIDEAKKEIELEHPEEFDPNREIYIYEIDSENIPSEFLKKVDDDQYVVTEMDELKPDGVRETTSGEILNYYKIIGFDSGENQEMRKMR